MTNTAFLEKVKSVAVNTGDIAIKNSNLMVSGRPVSLASSGRKDIVKMLSLNDKAIKGFDKNLNNENGGDTVVNGLLKSLGQQGKQVNLIINSDDLTVHRVTETKGGNISFDHFQENVDSLMKTGALTIENEFVTNGGTSYGVQFGFGDDKKTVFDGENIKLGFTLNWDLIDDVHYFESVIRQICTNGMIGLGNGQMRTLGTNNWYNELIDPYINGQNMQERLLTYENDVLNALQSNLSVDEFNTINNFLWNNWADDRDRVTRYMGDASWRNDYNNRGIDLNTLNQFQKRMAPTPVNAWDAINALTDMGSHEYRSKVNDTTKYKAQFMAGKMLQKAWDSGNHIANLPIYNVETKAQHKIILN